MPQGEIVKHRITIAAIATAAAIGGTCAFLVPAASASAGTAATHTLTFTAVQVSEVAYSGTVVNVAENSVNKAGTVIGYELLHVVINPTKGTDAFNIVFSFSGGFLYGVFIESGNPVIHGKLTGGTGAFQGATGTILAKDLNSAGSKTAVTLTYRT
jgi:hypothetical protein